MKLALLICSFVLLSACGADPGSERWCQAKKKQSKADWSTNDAKVYTMNCLIDGTSVGSEKWCKKLSQKPKGDWTADEAGTYAKHCVL